MPPKSTSSAAAKSGKLNVKKQPQKIPKQPLPLPDRLKRLFTSLCAQVEGGHFANAVKTCDKILVLDPDDQDALQTKLYLLLQTEQYAAALALVDDAGEHAFEGMYALYRLHRETEVESTLAELKEANNEDDRGVIHLEAQLNYRQGAYQSAYDLYNDLLDTTEPDTEEHSDIVTNIEATQKHLDFINSGYSRALSALPAAITTGLETSPPPAPAQSTSLYVAAQAAEQQKKVEAPAEKKVRVKRVPKGVVPGVTPAADPERWMKKNERSTFHTGHKRKKGGGGGGATQGSVESAGGAVSSGGGGGAGAGKGKGKKKK
ncbi:hypothetical protein EUX98_g5647 [Antrodiella citrinella]|uniref:Signal recognition particle subunit SRP72 n=1 Tax=Antrodiella citrinella TaxID=2447956 RepID=A0A4S4MR92_9APHY|nr:hypothetical protein EUX98_g5647 [Antrodiella citrinella]